MKTPKKAKQNTLKPLTVRQERFCELVVEGQDGTTAYLGAGWKGSREAAKVSASRLLTSDNVKARLAKLRKPQTAESLLTKDAKRRFYFAVVNDPAVKMADRLRASELDAKLAGDFAPEQHVVETGPKTLENIRSRAVEVAAALDRNAKHRTRTTTTEPVASVGLSRWNLPAGH